MQIIKLIRYSHTPHGNYRMQGTIMDLKKGAGRKMVWDGAPKRIWDYALEFEAYVRLHTSLNIYMLQG